MRSLPQKSLDRGTAGFPSFKGCARMGGIGMAHWAAALLWLRPSLLAVERPDELPPLRPPRGELAPTFWEQYELWVLAGGVLLLALVAFGIWVLTRPKRPVVLPPAVQARRSLEPLRAQPETGNLLSQVSQHVRHYFQAAFELGREELTTTEFCRAIAGCEKVGSDLAGSVTGFLQECDRRKFAPVAELPPLGAVPKALELLETAETRRAATEPPGANAPRTAAKSPTAQ